MRRIRWDSGIIAIKNKFLLGMVGTLALVQVLLEDDQEEH